MQTSKADIVIHPSVFNRPDMLDVLDAIENETGHQIVASHNGLFAEINRPDDFDPEPAA